MVWMWNNNLSELIFWKYSLEMDICNLQIEKSMNQRALSQCHRRVSWNFSRWFNIWTLVTLLLFFVWLLISYVFMGTKPSLSSYSHKNINLLICTLHANVLKSTKQKVGGDLVQLFCFLEYNTTKKLNFLLKHKSYPTKHFP